MYFNPDTYTNNGGGGVPLIHIQTGGGGGTPDTYTNKGAVPLIHIQTRGGGEYHAELPRLNRPRNDVMAAIIDNVTTHYIRRIHEMALNDWHNNGSRQKNGEGVC